MAGRRRVLKGFPISGGIVMGSARVVMPGAVAAPEVRILSSQVADEHAALDRAVANTIKELRSLHQAAQSKLVGPVAKILDAQLLIAGDQEFLKEVKEQIQKRRRNAGFVYGRLVKRTVDPLKGSKDRYMRQMAQDIEAVAGRVLSHLSGNNRFDVKFSSNTILVGKNFAPNDILNYRERDGVGFVVSEGGTDSHMALIARSLMLPVVQATDAWNLIPNGSRVIIDGTTGQVLVNPKDAEWSEFGRRQRKQGPALIKRLGQLTDIPPRTLDGREVQVAVNISLPGPADEALAARGFPVGLYRTEFMYLAQGSFPTEQEQYENYRAIVDKFAVGGTIIRTFDLGCDKIQTGSAWTQESNPALGWRGIRPMLDMTEIFKTQVRAILRASAGRNLKMMLPMISSVAEVDRARKLIGQVKLDLRRKQVAFDENMALGIMVEVPSAALMARALIKKIDFMSIGTNDLTQYTMAADRTNQRVSRLYDPLNPAVLNLVGQTVAACKEQGKPVSICGEIAGDPLALPFFIGLGVNSLSMNPSRVFDICRAVKKIDSQSAQLIVASVLSSDSARSVRRKLENYRAESERR
ncbi:MAG: phosphoenolpyruvate--protein phosphotransferase [bacterium]